MAAATQSTVPSASAPPGYTFLDDLPLRGFHYKIAALTFGAHFTEGYALGTIGYALRSLQRRFELDAVATGMLGSSALMGIFFGSLMFGWLSDRIGRQKIFLLSFLIITLAAFAQYFAGSIWMLCLLRVLLGFGMGGDFAVGHSILAEFSPRRYRGMLLGSFSMIWTMGYVGGNLVGLQWGDASPEVWRWLLASAALPALLVLLCRMGTPESPRWLLERGRKQEADAVLQRCFGAGVCINPQTVSHGRQEGGFMRLLRGRLLKRTLFNCIFFVCLVIPYFAIYTFLPGILRLLHVGEGGSADVLLGGLLILGAVVGIWLTVVLPRRVFLISSFAVTCASLLALSLISAEQVGALIAAFAVFTLAMSAVSNLVGVYPPECFPTDLRARGVGLAIACSRLGSAAGTFLLPIAMARFGLQPAMMALAAVLLLGMLVSIAWAPETRLLRLNEASSV